MLNLTLIQDGGSFGKLYHIERLTPMTIADFIKIIPSQTLLLNEGNFYMRFPEGVAGSYSNGEITIKKEFFNRMIYDFYMSDFHAIDGKDSLDFYLIMSQE